MTESNRADCAKGEHTPEKEMPLSETHQGLRKYDHAIVPLTPVFIAKAAHFFIIESVALLLALVLTWGIA